MIKAVSIDSVKNHEHPMKSTLQNPTYPYYCTTTIKLLRNSATKQQNMSNTTLT